MKTLVTKKLSNGNTITYQIINGTAYHASTNQRVIDVLEDARFSHRKLKIYFGDTKTGEDWHEEHYTTGYVERSNGSIKVPLLLHPLSIGGPHLMDDCIVKIKDAKYKTVLYCHPKYKEPNVEIKQEDRNDTYTYSTYVNGKLYGRHKSLRSAQICASKIR